TASTESTPRSSASSAVRATTSGEIPRRWVRIATTRSATVASSLMAPSLAAHRRRSRVEVLEDQTRVHPTEPEGVRERYADMALASLVWHVVEVTLGIR